jgi:hypothetical protein
MSKYGAKKTVVDGITFDSQAEARRYGQLKLLERAGEISQLRLQVQYILLERTRIHGKYVQPKSYVADFVYVDKDGKEVVEDVKGFRTAVFMLKRHLMKAMYGIEIQEVA